VTVTTCGPGAVTATEAVEEAVEEGADEAAELPVGVPHPARASPVTAATPIAIKRRHPDLVMRSLYALPSTSSRDQVL
jgi:hypothetical protein